MLIAPQKITLPPVTPRTTFLHKGQACDDKLQLYRITNAKSGLVEEQDLC